MKYRIHWIPVAISFALLTLVCLFIVRWIYVNGDLDPIGTVYITEIRHRLDSTILDDYEKTKDKEYFSQRNLSVPVLIWWTPFTYQTGNHIQCGNPTVSCFVSNIRKYRDNPEFSAFLFYGTDFRLFDLPLPRRDHEQWALLHEESPKNNFLLSFEPIMSLFNHTATFKRQSDLPLTTQWLKSIDDLLDLTYLIDVKTKNRLQVEENLAPIVYIQSDCNTPSDRDLYIEELMKFIPIDSYGKCLHNKDLPENLRNPVETMEHHEILRLVAKYKFALAFENALCTDYITEKFWRPLKVGTIPIVYGSDRFRDLLPDDHSAISMLDFPAPVDLANRIQQLNNNDSLYDFYRQFKFVGHVPNDTLLFQMMSERTWGIHNDPVRGNFINKFECLVCERVHQTRKNSTLKFQAPFDHYGCPAPITFDKHGNRLEKSGSWYRSFHFSRLQVEVFEELMEQKNFTFSEKDLFAGASKRFSLSFRRDEFL